MDDEDLARIRIIKIQLLWIIFHEHTRWEICCLSAYHNVPFLLVDVCLRLVLLCSQCECSLHDRQYLRNSYHSSLITMKIHETTPCHNLTWLMTLACAKICAQTIPIIFRTRHPKRNRSWQPCRPFRSVFFHCRYHSWQCAWPGYVVSASDHTGSTVLVLHYMHSQGENMLLTQTFTLLLDCIHSSFGTIGWSEAVHRPILSDTFHIKPLAKDPTNKILPTKWHHGKLKHPLLERFLWPCWNSLCDLRISRLWHCEKFIQEFKGWGTNSQFQLALGLAWDQRSPPRCIPAKNVANN